MIEHELAALRDPLLRFARSQLRNDSAAEDVVSETLLAILEKPESFEGRSALCTYSTGILIRDGMDEELPLANRARLRLHFVVCIACRNVNEQMQFLRRAMRQLGKKDLPD